MDVLLRSFRVLNCSIRAAVTGFAERDKVRQIVRFLVALHAKQAKRLDVMNPLSSHVTVLTGVIIALQGFPPLSLPVGATIIVSAVDILRMVQSVPMLITTRTRTVFSAALFLSYLVLVYFKGRPASKAYALHFGLARTCLNRRVLTSPRTVFTTLILQPPSLTSERLTAMPTNQINSCGVNASIYGLLAQVRDIAASYRAIACFCGAIRPDIKGLSTRLAN